RLLRGDIGAGTDIAEIGAELVIGRLAGQAPPDFLAIALELQFDALEGGCRGNVMGNLADDGGDIRPKRPQEVAEVPPDERRSLHARGEGESFGHPVHSTVRIELPEPVA